MQTNIYCYVERMIKLQTVPSPHRTHSTNC